MHMPKNSRSSYKCMDADSLRPNDSLTGRISATEEDDRRKKRTPLILAIIASIFVSFWETEYCWQSWIFLVQSEGCFWAFC